MGIIIRDVQNHELNILLTLNNEAGSSILPIDQERLHMLYEKANYFRVAVVDEQLAGFLIAVENNCDYDSQHFTWFKIRYPDFIYIDRVVIDANFRRHGLGRIFYADVQSFAEVRSGFLACEVFQQSENDVSMSFHNANGFREVGQQQLAGQPYANMLLKELCSYHWIRTTYLEKGDLPDVPWLANRQIA